MEKRKKYFALAFSLSMLEKIVNDQDSTILIRKLEENDINSFFKDNDIIFGVNPSHKPTILILTEKFKIPIKIPSVAPKLELQNGDKLLVSQVSGLPRLGGDRYEYTKEEIEKAKITFYLVIV